MIFMCEETIGFRRPAHKKGFFILWYTLVFRSLCRRCCALVEKFTGISPLAWCDSYRPLLNTAFDWEKPGSLQSLSGLVTIAVHVLNDLVGQLGKYLAVEMRVMMMVSVMLMILLR